MTQSKYDIAVIPGDGTGPEVIAEGLKVLDAVSGKYDFQLSFHPYDLGGEHYRKTGEALPDEVFESIKACHAIYLGAIGHPEVPPGVMEKAILLRQATRDQCLDNLSGRRLSRELRVFAACIYLLIEDHSDQLYGKW